MKRFIALIFNLQLCVCVCDAQYLKRESVFYPCLDMVIATYQRSYFRFPDNAENLISFIEDLFENNPNSDWGAYQDFLYGKILPYLRKNANDIVVKEEDNTYIMQKGNDTLVYVPPTFWPFSPCEDSLFIGGNPKDYHSIYRDLRIPRCYSSNNRIIFFPDSVYQDFEKGIRLTQQKYIDISNGSVPYKYYIYENDTVPILSMLEYNFGKPLRYYCSDEQIVYQLPFYTHLEVFLNSFCKLHQCKQILFMLPDYNLSDDNHL